MKVNVLVMAGGKGERLKAFFKEKPLIKLHGKPMIQYVIEALMKTKDIGKIIVVTSKHTPKTKNIVKHFKVEVLEALGDDYVTDVQYAVRKLRLKGPVMVVSADLPLLNPAILNRVIDYFKSCGKPALSVMVPHKLREKLGLSSNLTLKIQDKLLAPAGINILKGEMINAEEIEEEKMVLNMEEVAVNVNTINDLMVAEKILSQKSASQKPCSGKA
ncbi:adenosylcobinamide-phosphate guanylyltransferase [Candidatus Bathyarchaeota archaeon]|nr:MAG: adenosylcobinamide-phosphate guanylyltransferase [Candidatus Bathyarchaeota archaeon]